MKLYEDEAKNIFQRNNIITPKKTGIITSPEDAKSLRCEFPVIIKALVLIGGRGKAGGVRKVNNKQELIKTTNELLKLKINKYPVNKLLVEEAIDVKHEIYVSVTTDPATFDVTLITSPSGGVDIEQVAKETPEKIWSKKIQDNSKNLPEEIATEASQFIHKNLNITTDIGLNNLFTNLYQVFQNIDSKLCEINPLIITTTNQIVAVDAKIVLDDNALYRQDKLLKSIGFDPKSKRHDVSEQTEFEARAYKNSFPFVDLVDYKNIEKDSSKLYVGLIPGGAGYGIFSIDEVVNIGNRYFNSDVVPINFMDSGGGPSVYTVAEMFHLLMDHPLPDLIITSRFGGISSCDVFIRGLITALRDRHSKGQRMIPVYGRMVGTDLPSAKEFYEKAKLETPEPLKNLTIIIGNQKIMADIIKDAISYGFNRKKEFEEVLA